MLLRLATRSFLYRPEAGIQSILENERCEGGCYFSKRQRLIQTENFLCAACAGLNQPCALWQAALPHQRRRTRLVRNEWHVIMPPFCQRVSAFVWHCQWLTCSLERPSSSMSHPHEQSPAPGLQCIVQRGTGERQSTGRLDSRLRYAQARSSQVCLDHAESRSAHLRPRQDAYTSIAGRSKARMVLYFVPSAPPAHPPPPVLFFFAAAFGVLRGGHVSMCAYTRIG